jgi:hypothetical protein
MEHVKKALKDKRSNYQYKKNKAKVKSSEKICSKD